MLFNLRGDLIGQAEFCPAQMLGSCQYAVKWMLDEVGSMPSVPATSSSTTTRTAVSATCPSTWW